VSGACITPGKSSFFFSLKKELNNPYKAVWTFLLPCAIFGTLSCYLKLIALNSIGVQCKVFDFKCSGQPYATKVLGAIVLKYIWFRLKNKSVVQYIWFRLEQKLWHIYLRQKDIEHLNSRNCAGAEFQKFIGHRF